MRWLPICLVFLAVFLMAPWPYHGPLRGEECAFTANGSVESRCMYYAFITNRGASGAIEIELPAFKVGMEFCAINEAGESFTLDPNLTDQFLDPATDTGGDYLLSTVEGDVLCAVCLSANTCRVTQNTGGWNEE